MTLKPSDLTMAQRTNLVRFVREHRRIMDGHGSGVIDKDFGSKRGLEHLERKGAIYEVAQQRGPRGGVMRVLAPTPEGYRIADYIAVNLLHLPVGLR